MTFKELALKMLKRFPDGIWVHFHDMPDRFRIRNEIYLDEQSLDEFESRLKKEVADYYYLDEQSLDEFESRLKKEVADYYVDDFGYDVLEVTLKED